MWLEARGACPCGLMVHVLELLLLHATSERLCFAIMGRFHEMIKIRGGIPQGLCHQQSHQKAADNSTGFCRAKIALVSQAY
jgi:hypothetical protein